MKKTLAGKVSSKFVKRLQTSIDYHRELLLAVHLKKHQAGLETMLTEQFVFYIVVVWEVFLHDLLLSYLVMSPELFSKNLKERINQSVRESYGFGASQMVRFNGPKELSIPKAASLADPKGFNITVASSDHLTKRANELLTAKYARLFTLNTEDAQFVDFIISMRNYLAHRSRSARTQLKKTTQQLSGKNSGLRGSVSNIGIYLKTRNSNDNTRSIIIGKRLIDLASLFL